MIKLRKVNLKSSKTAQRQTDLYQQNKNQLGFLPSLFIGFLLVVVFGLGIWYFKGYDSSNSTVAGVMDSQSSLSNSSLVINNTQSSSSVSVVNSNVTTITTKAGINCTIAFQKTRPAELPDGTKTENDGYWIPQSCGDKNLLALQISLLNDAQLATIKSQTSSINLQILDNTDKVYAVVFNNDNIDTNFDLQTFLQPLTYPLLAKNYFDSTSVFDIRRINTDTFYLTGGCQGGVGDCRLWKVNSVQNMPILIQTNVVSSGTNQENQLSKVLVVRFAKTQDLANGLNFVIYDQSKTPISTFKLIRLDLDSKTILQTQSVNASEPDYKLYYR